MAIVDIAPTKAPAPPPPPPPPPVETPMPSAAVSAENSNWASDFLNNKAELPLTGFDFKTLYLFAYLLVGILFFSYVSYKLYRACQQNVLKKRLKAE